MKKQLIKPLIELRNVNMNTDILNLETINNYLSDYLSFGFKQEEFRFIEIAITKNLIKSKVDVIKYFPDKNNQYHLTIPLIFRIISQLAIVLSCVNTKKETTPGEVLLREIHLKCKSKITKTNGINVQLRLDKSKRVGDNDYFEGQISVEDNLIYGRGSLIIPIKK